MKTFRYAFVFWILIVQSCNHSTIEEDLEPPNIVWITSEDNSVHYLSMFSENGVATPNIEKLGKEGIQFNRAFSNAPVCSVARSTLITGCYAPRIGAQYHRKMVKVPMPDGVKMFPEYLREAGYYTSNNSKEDYNLEKSDEVWDDSSKKASWRNRNPEQPFFHVQNIGVSHESSLHFDREKMANYQTKVGLDSAFVQPNHPNTELFRYTNAYYRDKIVVMDSLLGNIVAELEADDLLENTIVFYFGDHGGVLPGSKGYLYETGLHVPLVVYVPTKYRKSLGIEAGSHSNGFVQFIDFGPTVLELAGISVPEGMDGRPFLGDVQTMKEVDQRDETYSYADRFDEKYDMVRSVRKGKYKYIRSFQPFNVDGLMNNYRYKQMAFKEWDSLFRAEELNAAQSAFFLPRPVEMLFDVEQDPFEVHNLALQSPFQSQLKSMRLLLKEWMIEQSDLSLFPEYALIEQAFDNPVDFGQKNKGSIEKYLKISDLALSDFEEAKEPLKECLTSTDPWERYWALTICVGFGKEAVGLFPVIETMAIKDKIAINRVRAAESLALAGNKDQEDHILNALYAAEEAAEALLMLNIIVLLEDGDAGYSFDIEGKRLGPKVRESDEVQRRLLYLDVEI